MSFSVQTIDESSTLLTDIKRLGKRNSAILGFFPEGAFDDHARRHQIVAATCEKGKLAGYLLYRVSNRTARIVHLCVDEAFLGNGVSRLLVDRLKLDTLDLVGISLKCRHDYKANDIWPRFGFVARGEAVGRGPQQRRLVFWWYDHGHPTLFDHADRRETNNAVIAAIDANVFFDFQDPDRDGYEESKALVADWLSDMLELSLAEEIYNEINQNEDSHTRDSSRARANTFRGVKHEKARYLTVLQELKEIHPKKSENHTQRDTSDLKHLAIAIAGDLSYFITRDGVILREDFCEAVSTRYALRIIRPSEFIRTIDELRSNQTYEPARLSGTDLKFTLLKSGQETQIAETFHQSEPLKQFKKRLRYFSANVDQFICATVESGDGKLLALVVSRKTAEGRTEVPVLRVCRGKLAPTLTRHLIVKLVNSSVQDLMNGLEINDEFLDSVTTATLKEDAYIQNEKSFVKFHVAKVAELNAVGDGLGQIICRTDKEKNFVDHLIAMLNEPMTRSYPDVCAVIEGFLFPLKIADAPIQTYLIPIRPFWAKELFDSDIACQGLFSSHEDLALRKEQVYYRSRLNHAGIKPPARILWYVTKDGALPHKTGSIRACSTLLEVTVDRPKVLFQKNKRLGIYSWENVVEAANGDIENDIMALRFGNTELFSNQITLKELQGVATAHKFKLRLFSIGKVTQSAFKEIYLRGTNKNAAEQ